MANYVRLSQIIDSVDKQIIEYGLKGRFYCEFAPWTLSWNTAFVIEYKYLSVKDIYKYDEMEIKTYYGDESFLLLIRDFFDKLKEINKQFNYYFNAIWC